jgi:arabinogalactan oligomer/maltooligosaccharide transport system substrate-binding protein
MSVRLRGLALVATVGLLAAACGGGDGDDAGATVQPEATEDAGDAAEGGLVVWADDTRTPVIQDIAPDFTAESGIEVTVVEKARDSIRQDFERQAPAGQGPDIIIGAHDWVGSYVDQGIITPVELGPVADGLAEVATQAFSVDGQTYGLPYAIENVALVRNADLAPEAPASWDELIATGQELVDAGEADLPFGVQMNGEAGDPYHFYSLLTSFGASLFGQTPEGDWDPTDVQLDNEGGLEYAAFLQQAGQDGILSISNTGDVLKEMFEGGRLPFWITGPWWAPEAVDAGINVVVEPLPGPGGETPSPFVGVQGIMISNFSENKLAATEFVVNFLGSEDTARALFDADERPPANVAVYEEVSADPLIQGFGSAGATGSPQPSFGFMSTVFDEWGKAEAAIVENRGDPATLWTTMADKVREAAASQ